MVKVLWLRDSTSSMTLTDAKHKLFRDMKAVLIPYNIFTAYPKLLRTYLQYLMEDYFKYRFIK